MHKIQENLLKEAKNRSLSGLTLREIGAIVEVTSPQKIKHHLQQLAKKGFIQYDPSAREIEPVVTVGEDDLRSVPIVGSANCGPATLFADENVTGYLKVSKRLVPESHSLFIIRADGESMNRASVANKNIDHGDFIVVDADLKTPKPGKYIVAVIDGMATVKRFDPEPQHERIVLRPESTQDFLPIYIHEDDNFAVCGEVVDVIKQ